MKPTLRGAKYQRLVAACGIVAALACSSVLVAEQALGDVTSWYFEGVVDTLNAGIGGRGAEVAYCDASIGDTIHGWFAFERNVTDGDSDLERGQYLWFNAYPAPRPVERITFESTDGVEVQGNTNAFGISVYLDFDALFGESDVMQLRTTLSDPKQTIPPFENCASAEEWHFELYCGVAGGTQRDALPTVPWSCLPDQANGRIAMWQIFPFGAFDANAVAAPEGRLTSLCSDPERDALCAPEPCYAELAALLVMLAVRRRRCRAHKHSQIALSI